MANAKLSTGHDIEIPTGSRRDNLLKARGFLTENFEMFSGNGTGASATDGTIFLAAVGVKEDDYITNIHVNVETAATGSGATLAKAALYDRNGNRLAVTGDTAADRTAIESTGLKTLALTAGYTVPKNTDAVYVGFVNKNGTTVCSLLCSGTVDAVSAAARTGKFQGIGTGGTSQTDVPTTVTVATTSAIGFWCGLS